MSFRAMSIAAALLRMVRNPTPSALAISSAMPPTVEVRRHYPDGRLDFVMPGLRDASASRPSEIAIGVMLHADGQRLGCNPAQSRPATKPQKS
jgi:hypothetical protein